MNNTVKYNQEELLKTIQMFVDICNTCMADYRIVGSVLVAATIGKVHRIIPDIDVMLDIKDLNCVIQELRASGFVVKDRKIVGMSLYVCSKENYTQISLMGIGSFGLKYFSAPIKYGFDVRILTEFVESTKYSLLGIDFIGIPLKGIIPGIKRTYFKPARKIDIRELSKIINLNEFRNTNILHLYYRDLKLPLIYDLIFSLKNYYGKLRMIFGKTYEIVK